MLADGWTRSLSYDKKNSMVFSTILIPCFRSFVDFLDGFVIKLFSCHFAVSAENVVPLAVAVPTAQILPTVLNVKNLAIFCPFIE